MAIHMRRIKILMLVSILFISAVIIITEFSPMATRYAVARIQEGPACTFIHIGDGLYYDQDTFIVYSGNTSSFDYRVPVPLRTQSGGNYIYNPASNEIIPS